MPSDATRRLIVNADDLGQDAGITDGVLEAAERGIVTSASLMVRWADASRAARVASGVGVSIGLHVDLGEWSCRDGEWHVVYQVVDTGDRGAVRDEVCRQVEVFRALVGRDPTHLDSHQHAHRHEPVRGILRELAEHLGVPLRGESDRVRRVGGFYGQCADGTPYPEGITTANLVSIINSLEPGVTELGCHPGRQVRLDTMYRDEREVELIALCAAAVHATLARCKVKLESFSSI